MTNNANELDALIEEKTATLEAQKKQRLRNGIVEFTKPKILEGQLQRFYDKYDTDDLNERYSKFHPAVNSTVERIVETTNYSSTSKIRGAVIECGLHIVDGSATSGQDGDIGVRTLEEELASLGNAKELVARNIHTDEEYRTKKTALRNHDAPNSGERIRYREPAGLEGRLHRLTTRLGIDRRCCVVHLSAIACLYSGYVGNSDDIEKLEKYEQGLHAHAQRRVRKVKALVESATDDIDTVAGSGHTDRQGELSND